MAKRDYFQCEKCASIPRERAIIYIIEKYAPEWKKLKIHESSPFPRGASPKLKKYAENYTETHFFPNIQLGTIHEGFRNENLEKQTFEDESFDLVITLDVFEHVFNPDKAFSEIARTLKPGGMHIFTVPLVNKNKKTEIRAKLNPDGTIEYLKPAEYHSNPVDQKDGSLMTMNWGYDIVDFIYEKSKMKTIINFIDNMELGIRAEYIEVLVSIKN